MQNKMIYDVHEFPKKKREALILSIQHILAMFVACVTVPLIVFGSYTTASGHSYLEYLLAPTLVSAGIGTIIYLILTKFKSPVFLASSFAYMPAMQTAILYGVTLVDGVPEALNLWILPIGMAMVGLVYVVVALLVGKFGTAWLNKVLPPVVVGPVIMVIGLGLSGSAVSNLVSAPNGQYNLLAILCGLVAMVVTIVCAHYGKKTVALIPFLIGIAAGYLFAVILTLHGSTDCKNDYCNLVNFEPLINNFKNLTVESFLTYPRFLFLPEVDKIPLTWGTVGQAALLFIPVSLVTMCEHIGDHKNLSGILERDLTQDPGLARTLAGDGIATAVSGVLCGAANTTYGENVAVVGVTKVASTKVILLAAILTILLGFFSPILALVRTIPTSVIGGISLILYGYIASSGIKTLISEKVDMSQTKNIFVSSIILVAGIGGLTLTFVTKSSSISVTSIAVAMIFGIALNLILKEKKVENNNNSHDEVI